MKSLADGLPPEIAAQIHPDWRKNEVEYWNVRNTLLAEYRNQWIGFSDRQVVASGNRPVTVFQAACEVADHPFCVCVGREDEPFRIRGYRNASRQGNDYQEAAVSARRGRYEST